MSKPQTSEPTSLSQWIDRLQRKVYGTNTQGLIAAALSRIPDAKNVRLSGFGYPSAVCDDIRQKLDALWSDVKFWKLIKERADEKTLQRHIEKKQQLRLPAIKWCVWREMVGAPERRKVLFDLLSVDRELVIRPIPDASDKPVIPVGLLSADLRELLLDYLVPNALDSKTRLRSLRFDANTLRLLHRAANSLVKDIKWLRKNKGQLPPAIKRGRGQPVAAYRLELIERMVEKFRANPEATNHSIAKEMLDSTKPAKITSGDSWFERLEDLASEAKHLAEFREQLRVRHHVQNGVGRRPRTRRLT